MHSLHDRISAYSQEHTTAPFDYVGHQERFSHPHQHMICGNAVGMFLAMLIKSTQAKNILEIGTMIGFSTICMAKHLPAGALIETIELRLEDAERAKENFDFFGVSHQIKQYTGNAKDIIPQINKPWDFVFIDADKINYNHYYDLIFPFVKKNASIVLDNMLFHNKVLEQNATEKNALAIQQMNQTLVKDQRVTNILLSCRDGLQWVIKN